ncbi:MAG: type II toxin-antitoxin system RatA family toxin [Pelagibacteraceae bacterium]
MPQKKIVKKFNYPIELIEKLILDIDEYKKFLPWCSDSRIVSKKENEKNIDIIADLEIGYSFAKDIYTSSVNFDKVKKKIIVKSIKGPLKNLENIWSLKKISNNECEVSFSINLELKNFLLNKMLTSMFDIGFDKILRSFENRANYLHKN